MRRAFTLVEILVVLVVIGILIGLILPNTLRAIRQAQVKECASNIRTLNSAGQLCFTETRNWAGCNSPAALLAAGYLEVNPVCPFADAYQFNATQNQQQVQWSDHFAAWPQFGDHLP